MGLKHIVRIWTWSLVLSCLFLIQAFAANRTVANTLDSKVKLIVDSDYITGKVNDPVSRMTKTAYIVRDNAEFHLESSSMQSADVVFYINSFVESQDIGVHNRVLKKTASVGETLTMLPEDVYESCIQDGSGYDFLNRCYDIRVYQDAEGQRFDDYYFGLVDDQTYDQMKTEFERVENVLKTLTPQD